MSLPTHLCGFIIKGMRIPRASRVEEVFATRHVPLAFSRKSMGKGRLCAPGCHQFSEGKRTPREVRGFPAPMFLQVSVYMCVAEEEGGASPLATLPRSVTSEMSLSCVGGAM